MVTILDAHPLVVFLERESGWEFVRDLLDELPRDGVKALMTSSIDSNPKRGWLEATGTLGSLVMDWQTCEVTTHENGTTVIKKHKNPESEGWKLYQNVADHLVKGEPLAITPEWARRPIHILDLACQSARKGTSLKARYK